MGFPLEPPHFNRWFIRGYIPAHHRVRVTGSMAVIELKALMALKQVLCKA